MMTLVEEEKRSTSAPPGAGEDWTIPQRWERFTPEDHRVWDTLFARQRRKLAGRVVGTFDKGLETLRLSRSGIPDFDDLNERLFARTGWTVVAVPGLLPDEIFFGHLARRRFPAGNFIRPASSQGYLEEPDVLHDVFGHVPMLSDRWFADFMQQLGVKGLKAAASGCGEAFSRLYWYTVEFGLAREEGALRVYGAGLASSFGEAGYALDSARPERRVFDLDAVLASPYRADRFQPLYFVIDGLEALRSLDFARLEERLAAL
ncbi:MAG TPA: phenylalanine 4-monooxygenase [Allosphingosinicella sp.]|jgi:phenylalanine-4-hydroxylase